MFSDDQMIEAVKSSLFMPPLPGRFEVLAIPGVKGRYGYGVHGGFINRVGSASLDDEQLPGTVQAVLDHFRGLKLDFSWFVTSNDTPDNLRAYLQQVGFERGWIMSGMVLPDLDQSFPTHPAVTVRPARFDERHEVSRIFQTEMIPDKGAADLFADMMQTPTMTHYLVYLDGVEAPVGVSSAFFVEEHRAVILEASLILEAYRGRGIYKSLIARRLHDAYSDGMQMAIVQANVETSAPALRKLGFVETCSIEAWRCPPAVYAD